MTARLRLKGDSGSVAAVVVFVFEVYVVFAVILVVVVFVCEGEKMCRLLGLAFRRQSKLRRSARA